MTAPDELIAGRYRLVRRVGAGAMGVVWEARDERLHRPVAVKQLHPQRGLSDADAELSNLRAMREARITARLDHPHAVPVYDVVEQDGQPCLIMQFLPSTPLSVVLRERQTLPVEETARIGAQVASALAAAHRVGIVHRDVKPGNILIAEDGTARISDFGISHAHGDTTLTVTGMVHGTPAYLAPEVARGADSSFASDVYGLGATLYTATEGSPPFGTDPNAIALLYRVASGDFVPPARSGELTPLILRMLAANPADRPAMADVARRLTQLATAAGSDPATLKFAEESVATLPRGVPVTEPRPMSERRRPADDSDRPDGGTPTAAMPVASAPDPTWSPPTRPVAAASPVAASGPRRRRPLLVAAVAVVALLGLAVAAFALAPLLDRGQAEVADPSAQASTSAAATRSSSASRTPSPSPSPRPSPTPTPTRTPTPTPTPTSPSPTPRPSASTTAPTTEASAALLAGAITDYYALMPADQDGGWARLTASYQAQAGGRSGYRRYWNSVERVSVSDATGDPPGTAQATITYVYKSGRTVRERTSYGLVNEGGVLKINSMKVLG